MVCTHLTSLGEEPSELLDGRQRFGRVAGM
jgi:hypothetical protein